MDLGRQLSPALCTTTGQDLAAVSGCHPLAEAVAALAHQTAGLVSPLHERSPWTKTGTGREKEKRPPDQGRSRERRVYSDLNGSSQEHKPTIFAVLPLGRSGRAPYA